MWKLTRSITLDVVTQNPSRILQHAGYSLCGHHRAEDSCADDHLADRGDDQQVPVPAPELNLHTRY